MTDISVFHNHPAQYILALFLTKPELYSEHSTCKERDRQDYFFYSFRQFAANYYNFSEDESVYFMSVKKYAAGEANICGGCGSRSGSYKRYFKDRHKKSEQARETRIDQFAKKYRVSFEKGNDPRLFLGVTEIWNKLNKSLEIVSASKWANASKFSYSDESFKTPIPEKVEKILIPLAIRNKTLQNIRNRRMVGSFTEARRIDDEDEYNAAFSDETMRSTFVSFSSTTTCALTESSNSYAHTLLRNSPVATTQNEKPITHGTIVVVPVDVYDEDW